MLTKSAVLRVHRLLCEERTTGTLHLHCLRRMTPLPFQHMHRPHHRLVTQEGNQLKAFAQPSVAAIPPLFPLPAARADHLGLSRRSPSYMPFP